ncbi:uncharacterized protein LOC141778417 [Sebastes fasciatus]|uniref:uncharacterized protein LOC141778417 n=1 Tax=Sebastes fasciatus TaxID=394691 RepID=UPI003D9E05E6
MAEAASPSAGSSGVATMAEEKQHPSLIQRVETMASVIELLLETLKDLSDKELGMFKDALRQTYFVRRYILQWQLEITDMQDAVFLMVLTDGQQSVERTKELLKTMNRTDLVQRLSDSSSGPKKKHSVDEHLSALIHKVATMRAVKELLMETLNDLSSEELHKFKWLLQFTFFQRNLPFVSQSQLLKSTRADLVEMMVEMIVELCGQQSVEVTEEIFMDMNRTDLVQRLSEISSGPKEKLCVDEHWPALTQEVETMASVIELLLETLKDLSVKELERFKVDLRETAFVRHCIPWWRLKITDMQDTVFLMVQISGQRSVEKTKEILKTMKRTDLVQRLSGSSSGPKKKHSDEHRPALIQKVATMAAVRYLLLETLNHLSDEEFGKFNEFLPSIVSQKNLPDISSMFSLTSDKANTVDRLVQTYGQQSVELTREVLQKMNKTDLMQMLSKPSSGLKEKQSVDEHQPAVSERHDYRKTGPIFMKLGKLLWYGPKTQEKALSTEVVTTPSALTEVTIAAVEQILLETLKDLSNEELRKFKRMLQFTSFKKSLPYIPFGVLNFADSADKLVDYMVKTCGQQSVETTREVLMEMNRTDLVERLSETSSGLKEKHCVDEHCPALTQEVETMASVIELLLETLKDLSVKELERFKVVLSETDFVRSNIPWWRPMMKDMQDTVFLMVLIGGQQSVERTKEVLKTMKRTDLVQRLSDSSSGPKKKHSDEHRPALIQKVATMAAVRNLLLETLNPLSNEEIKKFNEFLQSIVPQKNLPYISLTLSLTSDRANTVDQLVRTCGRQSVEFAREVLQKMNKTDLMQMLSKPSSGLKEKQSVDEHQPAVSERHDYRKTGRIFMKLGKLLWYGPKTQERALSAEVVNTPSALTEVKIAAVKQIVLKTLKDLSNKELNKFKRLLKFTFFKKSLPYIQFGVLYYADSADKLVDYMVKTCGQQSVEVTREVLMDMNRTDLVERLSETSSGLKEKHPSKPIQKEGTMTPVQEKLLETLKDLNDGELEKFKRVLQSIEMEKSLPIIPRRRMEMADRVGIVELMVQTYGQQSVEVTREAFKKMDRRDLVERLSDISSGSKEKQHPSLIQRVETMASVIELLLETLKDLSDKELGMFKDALRQTYFVRRYILQWQLEITDMQDAVFLMVLTDGQQSVENTKELLKTMNRTDLVQRLSDSSSGPKKKHSVDEHLSALIHKVATMRAVKELLMETLNDLSSEELHKFKWLLQFTFFQRNLPFVSQSQLLKSTRADLVEMMVEMMVELCGQQSVEVTEEIFMDMNRTDLVQRLSEISSGPKEKHCVDEHWPALTQEVETMASVIELLLETLKDLSVKELERFKVDLRETDFVRHCIPWWRLKITDMQDTVFLMVQISGQRSVKKTKEILKTMKRTDLVQRLSGSSSGPKKKHSDEHRPALIQKVATMAAVRYLLLETLNHLSDEEFGKFNEFLPSIVSQKNLPDISSMFSLTSDKANTVDRLVWTYGQQSVEFTREVLQKMNKTDLMQMLSKPSSGLKEKQSVDEHQPAVSETHDYRKTGRIFMKLGKLSWYGPKTQEKALSTEVVTTPSALTEVKIAAVKQIVLKTLKDLSNEELRKFKRLLKFTFFKKSLPYIQFGVLYFADSSDKLVDYMVKTCGQQAVEVTREVLMDMNRTDLVERSSEISSGLKEKHPSKPIQKERTMTPVQEKLLETLKDLNDGELEKFKHVLQSIEMEKSLPIIPRRRMEMADRVGIVELMVQTYGQQSVEVTREAFKKMDRRDLVERSSDISSGSKEKQHPSLIQRVETVASVIELLLETMKDSSDKELRRFKDALSKTHFDRRYSNIVWRQLEMKDMQDTVFLMVLTDGQQSVERTKEVLKRMNRTDLVQRLSDSSSRPKKKHSVDEHLSALIHKVATMRAVKELLLETLNDLSSEELTQFKWLLQFTFFQRNLPLTSWSKLLKSTQGDLVEMMVEMMVEMYGQQSVEVTEEIFMDMNRTDLVQRLSEISSGPKEKHCVDEHCPALTQEVETMASVIELLLETLKDLSVKELERFKVVLSETDFVRSNIPWWRPMMKDMQDTVFLMVLIGGQQSVERTKEILKTMKRTDLVQRLSDSSSGPKKKHSDEHRPALIQKVATMAAVRYLLLETLNPLSDEEIKKFNEFLQSIVPQKNLPYISLTLSLTSDRANTVDQLVRTCGRQSVEFAREVLQKMNKTDLMQMLSKPSSGLKEKQSVDEHQPAVSERVKIAAVKQIVLKTLKDLSNKELNKFKRLLKFTFFKKSLPYIQFGVLYYADSSDKLVDYMVKTCGQQAVEVTREVLMDMNRTDLVERSSEISSGLKEKHPSKPIQKEGTMTPVQEKLLETLKDLSDGELEKFKRVLQYIKMEKSLPIIPRRRMEMADRVRMVELMVETYGQQSVEVTREVFKKMNRTDLVERLSDISSGSKEKQHPSLIQRVETMASVIELLLETMKDLSDEELERFKDALSKTHFARRYSNILWRQLEITDMQDAVFLMVLTEGQRSVEKTKELLKTMKRTDLVQRLSDSSSGPNKKHSVDEHLSALIHKVATMTAVKELLMETLNDLSSEELHKFRWLLQFTVFQRNLPLISWIELLLSTQADLVEMMAKMMVQMCGHQSVEVTEEIFMDMNRTDLVQRLSEISSGPKEKHCVDEHWPALTQEVETMASVIELLLETLKDLSVKALWRFKVVPSETDFAKRDILWWQLKTTDMQDVVFFMVRTEGQQSVEKTKELLKTMKRTDLVQRLSDSSSGPKKKHSDEHRPALIQKVATIAAVQNLLFKTLKHLSNEEIWKFNEFLQSIVSQKNLPHISLMFSLTSDRANTVDQLVWTYGQQSVELTREVLQKMNKTDLMQMLSKPSSGLKEKQSVDEHQPAVSERHDYRKTGRTFMKLGKLLWYGPKPQEKALSAEVVTTPSALTVVTIAAVKQIVLKTLKDLSNKELKKFKRLLKFTSFKKSLPYIPFGVLYFADSADKLVDYMVKTCGQQSVEVTREVLMDMNRTDLVDRLSEISSGLKEKHPSKPIQKEGTMTPVQEKLLETLKDLSDGELEKFKRVLQYIEMEKSLPIIPRRRMEMADRVGIVELMVQTYGQQSVEVTREAFKKMDMRDLVERSSDISSGSKGPSRSLEPEAGGSVMQDSSDWTKLEPEVNSPDADESPTYSLQSEAGNFECGVSGLRWVCKQKVSFKYQFCSWEEPMKRMESIKYMAAGPLIDIKVIAGKLDEVYLPHWICIHDNPTLLDKFAVLHIDDCGDVVEKVSEVTSSHVKLSEPVFSLKAVLVEIGLLKIHCNVLIYKSDTAFLTLHVYVIPRDPGLQQEINKEELSYGYKVIRKPHPVKSLRMRNHFILTADSEKKAEINPENLKLRCERGNQNYFEVYIGNPDSNFLLELKQKDEPQPVWTHTIRKDEYQSTGGPTQGEHFVDKH